MREPTDSFWDVRAQEEAEDQSFERQISDLDKAIEVGRRANQIRNSAGFSAFVKAVEDLRNVASHKMVTDSTLTNDGLREMRSRVRTLDDVLALLTKENITDHLEARRAASQNDLDAARRRRPTKRQEVTT